MQEILKGNGTTDSRTTGSFVEEFEELIRLRKLKLLAGHGEWGKKSKQAVTRSRRW